MTDHQNRSKLFGCNIHGFIRVSAIALRIIDTPEFQRLKSIKQLALCIFVYPAATHTRFEHSIGVYHLAGKVIDRLKQIEPNRIYDIKELGMSTTLTDKIAECIKIAGLCHDIGHGPFSHVFDDILLATSTSLHKHHETRSCLITELICKRELAATLSNKDISFIKSLICPQPHHTGVLYQIVANYLNGIDVDKFDYLARDTRNLNLENGFNSSRLINELLIDQNGNICYPKHCSLDVYEMFHTRYMMHKKVYTHKTVKLVELMVAELIHQIDPIIGLTRSIDNMNDFCRFTDDSIFAWIRLIIDPIPAIKLQIDPVVVKKVTKLYSSLMTRKLYRLVTEINTNAVEHLSQFIDLIMKKYPHIFRYNHFQIVKITIGFVSGNKPDPFKHIYFYDNREPSVSFTLDKTHISGLINNNIQEVRTYLVCKKRSSYQLVWSAYKAYDTAAKL